MTIGVPKETAAGETRVALTPAAGAALIKSKLEVRVERGAGAAAGFLDDAYVAKGIKVVERAEVFGSADALLQVRSSIAGTGRDLNLLKRGCLLIGFCGDGETRRPCRGRCRSGRPQ
jgi:NAD(P) transhydrogenase subunit alpha